MTGRDYYQSVMSVICASMCVYVCMCGGMISNIALSFIFMHIIYFSFSYKNKSQIHKNRSTIFFYFTCVSRYVSW